MTGASAILHRWWEGDVTRFGHVYHVRYRGEWFTGEPSGVIRVNGKVMTPNRVRHRRVSDTQGDWAPAQVTQLF